MKHKALRVSAFFAVLLGITVFYYYFYYRSPRPEYALSYEPRPEVQVADAAKNQAAHTAKKKTINDGVDPPAGKPEVPATIEDLKQQIYQSRIEYIDDLDLLDDMVQPSAAEPQKLWNGNWVSADDWKRYDDTLKIEADSEGTYRLIPEKENPRAYTYDPEKKEFVFETNYYGKTLTTRARFLTDSLMVLTKISGDKAILDIYRRDEKK